MSSSSSSCPGGCCVAVQSVITMVTVRLRDICHLSDIQKLFWTVTDTPRFLLAVVINISGTPPVSGTRLTPWLPDSLAEVCFLFKLLLWENKIRPRLHDVFKQTGQTNKLFTIQQFRVIAKKYCQSLILFTFQWSYRVIFVYLAVIDNS